MKTHWQDDAQRRMSPDLPQYGRTRGLCSCDLDSGLLVRSKWSGSCSDAPLWTFDGGIYFVEEVKYSVHKPYLELHSGLRAVCLPWRVLKLLKVKEGEKKGESFVQTSVRLPDKRTLIVDSRFGDNTIPVLQTINEKLGDGAKSGTKAG